MRTALNVIALVLIVFTVYRACKKEAEYDRLINQHVVKKVAPSEAMREAEVIGREVDTVGIEKVVYRLSKPIIEKIVDNAKIDSLSRVANVDKAKIRSIDAVRASLEKENMELKKTVVDLIDGKKDTIYKFEDKWLVNTVYKRDTGLFSNVWVDASVNRIEHDRRRHWFFGQNENLSTIWYNSPYIRQSGYEQLKVVNKDPFFDYGLGVQSIYQNIDHNIYIGPKAKVKLGRFEVIGGYHWRVNENPSGDWWVGGNYIIR